MTEDKKTDKEILADKGILTEVISIKQEEQRTGTEIAVPDPEKLIALASHSLLAQRKLLHSMMLSRTTSKREIVRAVTAGLDLPTDKVPVKLKSKVEIAMFNAIQKAIGDRFAIIYHHIYLQRKAESEKLAEKINKASAKAKEEKEKTKTQEGDQKDER